MGATLISELVTKQPTMLLGLPLPPEFEPAASDLGLDCNEELIFQQEPAIEPLVSAPQVFLGQRGVVLRRQPLVQKRALSNRHLEVIKSKNG